MNSAEERQERHHSKHLITARETTKHDDWGWLTLGSLKSWSECCMAKEEGKLMERGAAEIS